MGKEIIYDNAGDKWFKSRMPNVRSLVQLSPAYYGFQMYVNKIIIFLIL